MGTKLIQTVLYTAGTSLILKIILKIKCFKSYFTLLEDFASYQMLTPLIAQVYSCV